MSNLTSDYICVFPFIRLKDSINILSFKISSFDSFDKNKEGGSNEIIINQVRHSFGLLDKNIGGCATINIPNTKPLQEIISEVKRVADLFRFSMSLNYLDMDYDQAIYFIYFIGKDKLQFISINGSNPTVFDYEHIKQRIPIVKLIDIDIPDNILPSIGLSKILLDKRIAPDEERYWRSLDWYGRSFIKDNGIDENNAVICLAIAFESLLNLPENSISASFSSYVYNLFNGSKPLVAWSKQFYELRSLIIHGQEVFRNYDEQQSQKKISLFYQYQDTNFRLQTVEIARAVFIDIIEGMSLLSKRKKRIDYDELFFSDKKRLDGILKNIEYTTDGISGFDVWAGIGAGISELRWDGSGLLSQIVDISKMLLRCLMNTIPEKSIQNNLLLYIKAFENKRNTISEIEEIISKVLDYLNSQIGNKDLPYSPIKKGLLGAEEKNLYLELIEEGIFWFKYAHNEVFRLEE